MPDGADRLVAAAAAGVTNVGKSLSKELGPKNIRVNSNNPGPVSTGMWLDDGGFVSTL